MLPVKDVAMLPHANVDQFFKASEADQFESKVRINGELECSP